MSVGLFPRTTQAATVGSRFIDFTKNAGSAALNVNGGGTPVVFTKGADASQDLVIEGIRFAATDNGIAAADKFLALNSALTNGVLVSVKSEDQMFSFPAIKTTAQFKDYFTFNGGLWDLLIGSGQDSLTATYLSPAGIRLKKQGTFGTDDYITVTISDNLSTVTSFECIVFGHKT